MADFQGVLASIPGYGGYLAKRNYNEQADMQDLQQASGLMGLLQSIQKQQTERGILGVLSSNAPMEQKNAALMRFPGGIEIVGKLAQIQKAQAEASQTAREQAVFSPENIARNTTPGIPAQSAIAEPAPEFGGGPGRPEIPAVAPQINLDALRQQAAMTGPKGMETYSTHQASEKQRLATLALAQQTANQTFYMKTQTQQWREMSEQDKAAALAQHQRDMIELRRDAFAARPQQALVQIMGPDGKPTWATRENAIGKTPAGAGSKAEATIAGKADVDKDIVTLKSALDALHAGGGITSVSKGVIPNIGRWATNTGPGQLLGSMGGTQNQKARDVISQARPLLLRSIMQATGMSARSLDSNAELKLWLSTATDPAKGYEANVEALNNIASKYGSGGFLEGNSGKIAPSGTGTPPPPPGFKVN